MKAALEKLRGAVFRMINHKRVNGEVALAPSFGYDNKSGQSESSYGAHSAIH